jgi:hypothetical protein
MLSNSASAMYMQTAVASCIGELANITTKIITLLEFFNFISEVSRFPMTY